MDGMQGFQAYTPIYSKPIQVDEVKVKGYDMDRSEIELEEEEKEVELKYIKQKYFTYIDGRKRREIMVPHSDSQL